MTGRIPTLTLHLEAGLGRTLAWHKGGSVRYFVADLTAGAALADTAKPLALNLAVAVDVSGSMEGDKLKAARQAALDVAQSLGPDGRLTLVAFHRAAAGCAPDGRSQARRGGAGDRPTAYPGQHQPV